MKPQHRCGVAAPLMWADVRIAPWLIHWLFADVRGAYERKMCFSVHVQKGKLSQHSAPCAQAGMVWESAHSEVVFVEVRSGKHRKPWLKKPPQPPKKIVK